MGTKLPVHEPLLGQSHSSPCWTNHSQVPPGTNTANSLLGQSHTVQVPARPITVNPLLDQSQPSPPGTNTAKSLQDKSWPSPDGPIITKPCWTNHSQVPSGQMIMAKPSWTNHSQVPAGPIIAKPQQQLTGAAFKPLQKPSDRSFNSQKPECLSGI